MLAFFSIHNTVVLVWQEMHPVGEEIRLHQWIVFKLDGRLRLTEQLPVWVLWSVGVRKLFGVSEEVEVIELVHQILGNVALRLKEPRSPVTVDQLPVSVDVHGVPAVIQGLARYCHTRPIVDALRPASDGRTR